MIEVEASMNLDGEFSLTVRGHADPVPCAAVTAFQHTALTFFEQYAERCPDQIQFTFNPALETTS